MLLLCILDEFLAFLTLFPTKIIRNKLIFGNWPILGIFKTLFTIEIWTILTFNQIYTFYLSWYSNRWPETFPVGLFGPKTFISHQEKLNSMDCDGFYGIIWWLLYTLWLVADEFWGLQLHSMPFKVLFMPSLPVTHNQFSIPCQG